jgi:hypothetical protein
MKVRIILGGIGIFILFLILGAVFRMMWFYFVQKEILEYTYIEKPLREAKGGGKTPEETWIGYLNALEKGDIEEAVQYIWPENRENVKKYLLLLKENGKLQSFVKSYNKSLIPLKPTLTMEKDEKRYTYLTKEQIENYYQEILKDPQLKRIFEEMKNSPLKNEDTFLPDIIFKYNPYTKRWLIK